LNASKYWGNDIQRNLDYISVIVNKALGSDNENYAFFIQEYKDIISDWIIYSVGGCNVATFKGINPNYPNWSYMFFRYKLKNPYYYVYYFSLGRGSGVTDYYASFITKTVTDLETASVCDCSKTHLIWNTVMQISIQTDWSLICDSESNLNAYLMINSYQWLYIKPKLCSYFFFAL